LCRRVAIIDHGVIIADDTTAALTGDASGAILTARCDAPAALAAALRAATGCADVAASRRR
jgi:ABC-type multidrug transport system ATPase subunit